MHGRGEGAALNGSLHEADTAMNETTASGEGGKTAL